MQQLRNHVIIINKIWVCQATSKARVKRIACCTVCVGTMTTTTPTGSSVLGDIAIRNKRKSTRRALGYKRSTHTYIHTYSTYTHTHTHTYTHTHIMCAVLSLCLYSGDVISDDVISDDVISFNDDVICMSLSSVLLVMSLVMMSSSLFSQHSISVKIVSGMCL